MKKSKLLSVMSIIFIISGISGIFDNCSTLFNLSSSNELLAEYGFGTFPAWIYVLLIISSGISLVAGIAGITYKSRKLVKIMGILELVFIIVSSIASGIYVPIGLLSLFGVISPLLYLWGLSKSE